MIRNYDVSSYYPHLMTLYNYTSRNIPSPDVFAEILDRRMAAKAAGDKATANALKLVVNTTYGAMLNQYNDLCDPLMGRSVCVSGQLFLLELANHLHAAVDGLKVVQVNTDGIMVEFDDSQYGAVQEIVEEWQTRTGFELEEDSVKKIIQKDVNNYIELQPSGEVKMKGGYVVRGISTAGAFKINNNACIVSRAIVDYFVYGIPVEKTIETCQDLSQFQMIAKAGSKYREAFQLVDGKRVQTQKVNRVYATADERYGTLYKVKDGTDSIAKIESLPEHCIIDNDRTRDISEIDKQWYIDLAKKRINDFLGTEEKKGGKKMAAAKTTAETKNVYQKLLQARAMFVKHGIQKSGKHFELKYKYFELDDIVPIAIDIFSEVGLVPLVRFSEETAYMDIVNVDMPEQVIEFCCPMRYPSENRMVNPVQALGSAQTYLRRYLYMLALDICEPDSIEPTTVNEKKQSQPQAQAPTPAMPEPKAPATPEVRKETKRTLTNPDGPATDRQLKQLKSKLKQLIVEHPDQREYAQKLAIETKGFEEVTKVRCEELLKEIGELLK